MRTILFYSFIGLFLIGCLGSEDDKKDLAGPQIESAIENNGVVRIVTNVMEFTAPDTIHSGWTTFEYHNQSDMIHMALLDKMPGDRGIGAHQDSVAPVFQNILDGILGNPLSEPAMGTEMPDWFSEIVFLGGPGLVGSGKTAVTTVSLPAGTYVMECYVKTGGLFHSYNPDPQINGMVHEFTVIEAPSDAVEPESDLTVSLSGSQGMTITGDLVTGLQTIRVVWADQKVHENFVGHDVHLVRMLDDADVDSLNTWMNWMQPTGLQTPAPNGFEFLGGANEMPAGSVAYFSVDIEPGKYAFISEVSDPASKNMLRIVEVPDTI